MHKPYISNYYIQASIRGAENLGYSKDKLLTVAGLSTDWLNQPDKPITEQQLTRLMKLVWRMTGDEFMGFGPHICHRGVFSLIAEFCLFSKTLGGALQRCSRFYHAVYNPIKVELDNSEQSNDGMMFFKLHLEDTRNDVDHFLQEFLLLMWQRFSSWLVGQHIPFSATQFSYPLPNHGDEYTVMFQGDLIFDKPVNGFYIHSRYLNLPIVKSVQQLEIFLSESPAYILYRPRTDLSLKEKIRSIFNTTDHQQIPSLDSLADLLHMTPRTINRKLKEEGTSYREIKAKQQCKHAVNLLSKEHLSITEVGIELGFVETASFTRAFKRWTGKSPSTWMK